MRTNQIFREILKVLANRKGFSNWWDDIRDDDKKEIESEIKSCVAKELEWRKAPNLSIPGRLYWYRYDGYHACPAWIDDLLGPYNDVRVWLPTHHDKLPLTSLDGDWFGPLPEPTKPTGEPQ